MENPVVAGWLAAAAGSMDGFTFFSANTFSTVQSGNVVQIGYWIANDNWHRVLEVGLAIVAFGLGVMVMAAIEHILRTRGRTVSFHVLFVEAAVLATLGLPFVGGELDAKVVAYVVSFLAGMQGSAFHKAEGMVVSNVAVTLNVQLAFNFLTRALLRDRRANLLRSGVYTLVLVGFAAGGIAGGLLADRVDERALWFPAVLLLALGVLALSDARRRLVVDPRP